MVGKTEVWLSKTLTYPVTVIGTHFTRDQQIKPGDLIYTLRDASGSITRMTAESGGWMVADPLPINSVFGQAAPVAQLAPVAASPPVRAEVKPAASPPQAKPKPAARKAKSGEARGGVLGFVGAVLLLPLLVGGAYLAGDAYLQGNGLAAAAAGALVWLFVFVELFRVSLVQGVVGSLASAAVVFFLMGPQTGAIGQ